MIGREAPLDFFRRSGIPIRGEWKASTALAFAAFSCFCVFLYNWKAGGAVNQYFQRARPLPVQRPARSRATPPRFPGTLSISLRDPGFYYSFAYCAAMRRLRHPPHPAPQDAVRPRCRRSR